MDLKAYFFGTIINIFLRFNFHEVHELLIGKKKKKKNFKCSYFLRVYLYKLLENCVLSLK